LFFDLIGVFGLLFRSYMEQVFDLLKPFFGLIMFNLGWVVRTAGVAALICEYSLTARFSYSTEPDIFSALCSH
jgi:hypothetical protein